MAEVGLPVIEARGLDVAGVKWALGRFGKLHVRMGKGSRGSGPREPMVPLINDARQTPCWFVEDVWSHFDDDHARPGAPLFPSERRNADGTSAGVGNKALRASLVDSAAKHLPDWPDHEPGQLRTTPSSTAAGPLQERTGPLGQARRLTRRLQVRPPGATGRHLRLFNFERRAE